MTKFWIFEFGFWIEREARRALRIQSKIRNLKSKIRRRPAADVNERHA
jgi:hypothetical protein